MENIKELLTKRNYLHNKINKINRKIISEKNKYQIKKFSEDLEKHNKSFISHDQLKHTKYKNSIYYRKKYFECTIYSDYLKIYFESYPDNINYLNYENYLDLTFEEMFKTNSVSDHIFANYNIKSYVYEHNNCSNNSYIQNDQECSYHTLTFRIYQVQFNPMIYLLHRYWLPYEIAIIIQNHVLDPLPMSIEQLLKKYGYFYLLSNQKYNINKSEKLELSEVNKFIEQNKHIVRMCPTTSLNKDVYLTKILKEEYDKIYY